MTPSTDAAPDRARRWAEHPAGPLLLVLFALLEATLFPAPTEALLVALVLARPLRAWSLGALATLASVAGGALGYAVGAWLAAAGGAPGAAGADAGLVAAVAALYRDNLPLALATSGYTPIPYLAYTAAGGALGVPLAQFLAFSLVGRALKYLPLALAARLLGPRLWEAGGRRARRAVALLVAALLAWLLVRSALG